MQSYNDNPEKAWAFAVDCVVYKVENISIEHPDFMNRIPIALFIKALEDDVKKDEAFNILSNLIRFKGLPVKAELIFKELLNSNASPDLKWNLVKTQLDDPKYRGLPLRHVEPIVVALANDGHGEAIKQMEIWAENTEYNKIRGFVEESVIDNIPKMLDNPATKDKGISILKDFIESENFKNDIGEFKVWDIARYLAHLIRVDKQTGIAVMTGIWNTKPLTENQQTLLTSTLGNLPDDDKALLKEIYESVPSIWFDECKDDIKEIEKIFIKPADRYSFISFGEKLIAPETIQGVMRIIKIFSKDSDPQIETQDLHQRMKDGERTQTLSTVRGRLCFFVEKATVDHSVDYLPDIISVVEDLTKDPNYYVRSNACYPLRRLMQLRHSLLEEERFMSWENVSAIERVANEMLNDVENQKVPHIMHGIIQVFDGLRTLTEEEALSLFKTIVESKDEQAISEALHIFVYYAEFRKDAYTENERLKTVFSDKELENLNSYDGTMFRERFLEYIQSKDFAPKLKASLAWTMWKLPTEGGNISLDIPLRYFPLLIDPYDKDTYADVYYFIADNYNADYKRTIDLWKRCIPFEKEFLEKNLSKESFHDLYWLPYFYNGKILSKIYSEEGQAEFIKWLDILLDYPEGVIIANDLDTAIEILKGFDYSAEIEALFNKLVNREGKYFETRKEWLTKKEVAPQRKL